MDQCRSLFITILLLWLVLKSKGSPEIGFSARLTKDVSVPSSKLTVVSEWENRGYSLLFEYGVKLAKGQTGGQGKERTILPFSGLFLVSANLMVKVNRGTTLKICITSDICQETAQNERTITIALQSYFLKGTVISIKLLSEFNLLLLKDSSFAVQYLGPVSRKIGFLALLPSNRSLEFEKNSNYVIVKGWMKETRSTTGKDARGATRGSTSRAEKLAVQCSGIYLVTMMLSFLATKGVTYEVRLISNKTEIVYKRQFCYNGIATVSLLKNMEMLKDDPISVEIMAVNLKGVVILKGSRLAAVYMGNSDSKFISFVAPLKKRRFDGGIKEHIISNYLPQNVSRQKNIKEIEQENYQIAMPKHGVYIITLHLNVKISPLGTLSTEILVYDKGLKASTSLYGQPALTICSSTAQEYKERSLVLTGILALETHDFIKISLKSSRQDSFMILENSWISFMAVGSHDFAASFHLKSEAAKAEVLPSATALVLNATKSDVFLLNEMLDADNKKFRCPLNGIYIITMNLVIFSGKSALRTASIHVVKRNTDPKVDNSLHTNQSIIFNAHFTIFNGLTAISPTFVHSLKENDILSFHIIPNPDLEVRKESSLFISLIDFIGTGRTFISEYSQVAMPIEWNNKGQYNISSWIPRTQGFEQFSSTGNAKAPTSGFYLVSCYVQLECLFNKSVDSLELSLLLYFNDKDQEFGLKDRIEVMRTGNGTVYFYLSVSGVLEARKDALLMTLLRSNKFDINMSIVYSELSVSLNSPSEISSEIYRSLQSSTKLLSFKKDNWVPLDRRIYSNTNGEFKSESVEFLGLRFHAQKSILAFVSATTILHGVNGIVEYGVVVGTGSELKGRGLTTTVEVRGKHLRTLKWTGLVYMEPWQQISLVVRITGNVDVQQFDGTARTSWSSLAFMALSFPQSAERLQPLGNSRRVHASSDAWYVFVQQTQPNVDITNYMNSSLQNEHEYAMLLQNIKNGGVFGDKMKSYQAVSLPKFKLAREQKLISDVSRSSVASFDLGGVFKSIKSLTGYFKRASNIPCIAGIVKIALEVKISSNCTISLEYTTEKHNSTLCQKSAIQSTRNILEFNGILCLNMLQSTVFKTNTVTNLTILQSSVFSFVLIDSSINIEGFSVSQISNQHLNWPRREHDIQIMNYIRLDGWNISSTGFDSTRGFKMPFGSYTIQTNGRYLATANIILKAALDCKMTIAFYKNGHHIPLALSQSAVSNISIHTISLASLLDVEKWDVLELKISSNLPTSFIIFAGSTFSAIQLDQDISFQRCETDSFQLKSSYEKEITKRIGTDVILNCTTTNSMVADFYWLRNNKVTYSILSSTEGTLIIRSASFDDSGYYVCKVQTGDFSIVSQKIRVIVYDPTPQISVANQTLYIAENSPPHQVLTEVYVKAATPHETEDALVHFTIKPENMVRIFYLSPDKTRTMTRLKSRVLFDYEARKEYEMTILAKNIEFAGIANYSKRITVNVVDRNDNAPQFEKRSYKINILENATMGTTLLTLEAHDKDIGANAKIQYYLHETLDSKLFHIGKENGILTLRSAIDIRRRRSLTLFAIATNGPYSTFCEIVVNIIDINDKRPYFQPSFYSINVTETTEVGTTVAKILAFDLDIEAKNRHITYKLKQSDKTIPFTLEDSGNIKIVRKLGKFAGQVFTVRAFAFDGHGLESSNEATIVLRIIKTIHVPSFFSGLRFVTDVYRIKVREDVPVGTLLVKVKAFNPDNAYSSIRYVFVKPEDRFNFTVSENDGEIRTSRCLDYERQHKYSLTVFACDVNGISECTAARVDIYVEDINDNYPEFTQKIYHSTISEYAEIGSSVMKVVAIDADSGTLGSVRYEFDDSDSKMFPFSVGQTDGILRVSKKLTGVCPTSLIFIIRATDGGSSIGEALLDIEVLRNDSSKQPCVGAKPPKFDRLVYSVFVKEDTEVGQQLATINASTFNGTTSQYFLFANENETFLTNSVRGGLYLQRKLDYEKKRAHELLLIARIRDDVRLRSYARIHVNVVDVNDNRPILFEKNHVTFLKGTLKPGRFVTKISAFDLDSGANGQILYAIDKNLTVPEFSLDAVSGNLLVNRIGNQDKYVLPVKACDKGVPSLCDYGTVTIHISKDSFEGGLRSSLIDSNYTYARLEFNIDKYIANGYERIRFIAQEVHFQDPYYGQYTQLPPVTWYDVYYKRDRGHNYLRRYIAAEKPGDFEESKRISRDLSPRKIKTVQFKYGDEEECGELWKANRICNGPLRPGTQYRFQLEIKYKGSSTFLKTGFTKTYKTGPAAVKHLPVITNNTDKKFPFWIALIAVSSLLVLILLLLLICYCCYRRSVHRRKKHRYEVAIQNDGSFDEFPLPWKTETESQELTVWFSEDSICNGSISASNSISRISKL